MTGGELICLKVCSTFPFVILLEKQGHALDAHLPADKGFIHAVEFRGSYIIIDSLCDSQQAVDL